MSDKPKRKRWYFSPIVKVLAFIIFMPAWALIVLDDPDSTSGVKLLGGVVLIGSIILACLFCSGNL